MKKLLLLPVLVLSMHLKATEQNVTAESLLTSDQTVETKPEAKQKSFFARHFGKILAANLIIYTGNNIILQHSFKQNYKLSIFLLLILIIIIIILVLLLNKIKLNKI